MRTALTRFAPALVFLSLATGAEEKKSDPGREGGKQTPDPTRREKPMRWRFGNETDKEYAEHRSRTLRQIDAWWKAFERDRARIEASFQGAGSKDWDLPGWMERHLQAIDPRLMWEFGPDAGGGHRLAITPESDRHLRPMVETLIERAPRIDGWRFLPYRPSIGVDNARAMLKARRMAPIDDTRVRVGRGENNRIDLTFLSPRYTGPDDEKAMHSVFIASESLLGEEVLDTWIGAISVDKEATPAKDAVALDRMQEAVEREIARIRESLPDAPAWKPAQGRQGTVWKLEPEKAKDYTGQEDIFVARSTYPEMWKAARSGSGFSSRRFSRFGEVFGYVKMDGSEGLGGETFKDKAAIEDALDAALKAAEAGAVIGGGTGLRYSYVEIALTDPEKGVRQVIEVLRKGNITKRSWILFHDDVNAGEWIGVWEDTPAPPGF